MGIVQRAGSGPSPLRRESLDEAVLRVQAAIREMGTHVPFCAFNGGNDVFVDIGNKRVGVAGLQTFIDGGVEPQQCLHVGDQFLNTGNDFAARSCCATVWVTSPVETFYCVRRLLRVVKGMRGGSMDLTPGPGADGNAEGVEDTDGPYDTDL